MHCCNINKSRRGGGFFFGSPGMFLCHSFMVFTVLYALHATRSSYEKAVCLSVRLSNACIVIKGKKNLSRFLYHTKDHLA